MDEMVYIPATTMMSQYSYDTFQYLSVKTSLPTEEARFQLEVLMRDLHNIDNPEGALAKDDFYVSTAADAAEIVTSITGVLQILLSAIAAISLLVGGVGIMNIMYVSVTERVTEIGLRKAIGASSGEVLNQFLLESVLLTLGGGIGGVVLGTSAAWLAIRIINNYLAGWEFIISFNGIIFGVIVSTIIGIIFGYAPAKTAAKLDPIVALRKNE
jgi:putative ABC transport system permease protein